MKKQVGSGFTFNQSDVIGGQMGRVGYSECDIPSYYNKAMVYDVAVPVQQSAGARKTKKSKSKSKSKSHKKSERKTQKKSVKKSKSKSKSVKKSVKKVRKSSSKRHRRM